jgi:hypothetical protein
VRLLHQRTAPSRTVVRSREPVVGGPVDGYFVGVGGDDPHHRSAGGSSCGSEPVDVRDDLRSGLDLDERHSRQHERVLHVDDDQRSGRRVQIGEDALGSAPLDDPVDDPAWNIYVVQVAPAWVVTTVVVVSEQ